MRIRLLYTLLGVLSISLLRAQDYQISFTGSGASTTVDSVKVENLSQCTTTYIAGGDILHLTTIIGLEEATKGTARSVHVYPNPMRTSCLIDFIASAEGNAVISLTDISGRKPAMIQEYLLAERHSFKLKGLSKGVYFIKVESENYSYHSKLISLEDNGGKAEITMLEGSSLQEKSEIELENRSSKSVVDMYYESGDLLKITGKSGNYRTVVMLTPASSQTLTFNFMACTDADGNSYAVVQIGNQWWMAENLNVGTYVPITTPQAIGTKFCQDYSGQNDPTCPMGGLYEWNVMMQGASPCNGSGPPPNDRCTTPVKGICPLGWHIPSHYEWTTLERNSGSSPTAFPYDGTTISLLGTDEGGNLKETCTSHWWAPNLGATNETGFTALPGGSAWQGVFDDFGQSGYYWSTTEQIFMYAAWVRGLNYSLSNVGRSGYFEESGFNVRCVKD